MTRKKPTGFRTGFGVRSQTLVIDLGQRRRILSSAVRGGGLVLARYILNHQVPADPVLAPLPAFSRGWCDPSRYLGRVALQVGAQPTCVALMTAVDLRRLVVLREETDRFWVEGFFTVGVTNAVRAGEPPVPAEGRNRRPVPGTINMILVTNARLTIPAMVEAVQVATECKTAVLLSESVPSWTGLPGATGTGTDAVVVACGQGPSLRYSGTHTQMGAMIGRLVRRGIAEGLRRSNRWTAPAR